MGSGDTEASWAWADDVTKAARPVRIMSPVSKQAMLFVGAIAQFL
jgi:hypothetical protein